MARTIEGVIGGVFSDERIDAFLDDDGDVHEDSINTLAGAGIVRGVGSDHFRPAGLVSRAQLATYLAESAGFLDSQARWVGPSGT